MPMYEHLPVKVFLCPPKRAMRSDSDVLHAAIPLDRFLCPPKRAMRSDSDVLHAAIPLDRFLCPPKRAMRSDSLFFFAVPGGIAVSMPSEAGYA